MNRHNSLLVFTLQLFVSSVVLFCAFVYFDPISVLDREADSINILFFGIILPIIFIAKTIAICLLLGLPFRLIPKLHNWWVSKPLIQLLGLTSGIVILFLSINMNLTKTEEFIENGETVTKDFANLYLSLSGWFLTAFFSLNLYPTSILEYLSDKLSPKGSWMRSPNR